MIEATYVDHMGTDLTVANAARRSHGVEHQTFETEPRRAGARSDDELIRDLARDGHLLPFRHPHVELSCAAPLPVARQLGKHQVGMEWSEISRRYRRGQLTFHRLDGTWRADVADRRQGSGDLLPTEGQAALVKIQTRNIQHALEDFDEAMALGASLEQARFLLPQSMDVLWTWTGSLLAWAHVFKQRHHRDAQAETREFARHVGRIMRRLYPVSWAALTEVSFDAIEAAIRLLEEARTLYPGDVDAALAKLGYVQ